MGISDTDTTASHFQDTLLHHEVQKDYTDLIFTSQEYSSHHNPYDQEVRELSCIRTGDLEGLKRSWAENYTGKPGTLAKSRLRNNQNLAIVILALASRAAIEGGVLPEAAYSLTDVYINKVEEIKVPELALQLSREAEYQFALLVKEIHEQNKIPHQCISQNEKIRQCKAYIFSHLHEKISTARIAKELYMNANYLSGLFKRKEGITIREYILREKINLAKNMLIYSKYSYTEIASYLSFCSQSYLGEKFKKITGYTLNEYRTKYGVKGF